MRIELMSLAITLASVLPFELSHSYSKSQSYMTNIINGGVDLEHLSTQKDLHP